MRDAVQIRAAISGKTQTWLMSCWRLGGAACLAALLAGCASLRIDPAQRPASYALADTDQTALASILAPQQTANPGLSGFRLVLAGKTALEARIQLCRVAEKSIDMQYYLWNRDRAGGELAAELKRAADRGVRVRVILDDIFEAE